MAATVCRMGHPTQPPTPAKPRPSWRVAVIIALVLLALGYVINRGYPDGNDARLACRTFVQDQLNARPMLPDSGHDAPTASFSNMQHVGAAPTWTVTGDVQVGADFRYHFTCQVRLDGDVFRLVSLTGLPN